MLTTAIPDNDL